MGERRDRLQIIIDILSLIQKKGMAKTTHILYGSNLSHIRLKLYIKELEDNQLITTITEKGKTYYQITEKGLKLIDESKKIKDIVDAFGL